MMKRSLVYHISLHAMFIALYFVLAKSPSFRQPSFDLGFASLLVSAFLLGLATP
jgi:hypothetical protein